MNEQNITQTDIFQKKFEQYFHKIQNNDDETLHGKFIQRS